ETLTKSFGEVQSVLDLNRRLIQQANDNHRSKIPRNLATNVELIRELMPIFLKSSAFTPISLRVSPTLSNSGDMWPEMPPRGLNP
ncbi:protein early flowering 4, partial [Phtheirospermum japonicum]